MNNGFIIKKLLLIGEKVKPAIVEFEEGLNIITGPTDTGKSFIYDCIDYMMGGSKLDRIPTEAADYNLVFLEIKANQKYYTLERAIKGGGFKVYETEYKNIHNADITKLSPRHNQDKDNTISAFFLKLINNWDKKIRKNKNGEKRTLSFRDICHLIVVDEEKIITKQSPFLSTAYVNKTAELNVVKYFSTGNDDNAIVTNIRDKIVTSINGKIELLEELISNIKENDPTVADGTDIEIQISNLSNSIRKVNKEHNKILNEFSKYESLRKKATNDLVLIERKIDSLTETLSRSKLLKEHYNTDIKRLKSTIEAGILLSDNVTQGSKCPYCNNPIKTSIAPNEIELTIKSCEIEIEKILKLDLELKESITILRNEKQTNVIQYNSLNKYKESIEEHLNKNVKTQLEDHINKINELNETKNSLIIAKLQKENIKSLIKQKDFLFSKKNNEDNVGKFDSLTSSTMQPICDNVLKILKKCNYPNIETVSYSEKNNDIIISGKDRNLSGKGKRAITFASLILAIIEHIKDKDYTIGVPVFDSPLVTYSKPKANGEGISQDLAMDFYRYCANNSSAKQIIILENEEPPKDIIDKINHIVFEGPYGKIRKGFIPTNN